LFFKQTKQGPWTIIFWRGDGGHGGQEQIICLITKIIILILIFVSANIIIFTYIR